MEDSLIDIIINFKGKDIPVRVSVDVAEVLCNDHEAANVFIENLILQNLINISDTEEDISEATGEEKHQRKKPFFFSEESSKILLQLRAKYAKKFDDKKTIKSAIWKTIAEEMNQLGHCIGDGREAIERLRQRFANLSRNYYAYKKHVNTTGAERRDPPPFYEEIHDILGQKDKATLPHLSDTIINEITPLSEAVPGPSNLNQQSQSALTPEENKENIKSRFSNFRSVRPESKENKLIKVLTELHEKNQVERNRHMEMFEKAINVQNEQRERFLNIFEQNFGKRKRDYKFDSDESDDE